MDRQSSYEAGACNLGEAVMVRLMLSRREIERLNVMNRVALGEMTMAQAAEALQLSSRQMRRLRRRYEVLGPGGLVHGLRGRPSNRAKRASLRLAVLARYRECYSEHGPTVAAARLVADGYQIDHETLRRWLLVARRDGGVGLNRSRCEAGSLRTRSAEVA